MEAWSMKEVSTIGMNKYTIDFILKSCLDNISLHSFSHILVIEITDILLVIKGTKCIVFGLITRSTIFSLLIA